MLAGCETVFSLITRRHHSSHNKVLSRSLLLSCRRLTCDCLCAGRVPGTAIRVCQSVGMRPGDQESGPVLPVCHFPSPHATVRREHYLTISDSKHHNHRVISVCHDISLIRVPSFLRDDIFSWRVLTHRAADQQYTVHGPGCGWSQVSGMEMVRASHCSCAGHGRNCGERAWARIMQMLKFLTGTLLNTGLCWMREESK